jgi:hypothetical protein
VETIDPELAAMLVALAAAVGAADDAPRDAARCARALARLDALPASSNTAVVAATRTTVRVAQAAARARRGELARGAALDLMAPAPALEHRSDAPFHDVVRALAAGALFSSTGLFARSETSNEEARIGAALERAERIAAETGTTLLDACATTALGTLLVAVSPQEPRALLALERAGTLLAHGDAPSLEHQAEVHRAVVLIALGRWSDASVHLRCACEAANAERAPELEVLATALQAMTELAAGDRKAADETIAVLGDARLAAASARVATFGWIARALSALSAAARVPDRAAEEILAKAEARARELDPDPKGADAHVLLGIVRHLFEAARGSAPDGLATAAGLERLARERGVHTSYWLDLLVAVIRHIDDTDAARQIGESTSRLRGIFGPSVRAAAGR